MTSVSANDIRCFCGGLIARVREGGIELKCRRCKRTIIIPYRASGDAKNLRTTEGDPA